MAGAIILRMEVRRIDVRRGDLRAGELESRRLASWRLAGRRAGGVARQAASSVSLSMSRMERRAQTKAPASGCGSAAQ